MTTCIFIPIFRKPSILVTLTIFRDQLVKERRGSQFSLEKDIANPDLALKSKDRGRVTAWCMGTTAGP